MRDHCTLTNEELIAKAQELVNELAKTGGRSWHLRIPVNFNRDPDMIFLELTKRLASATTWIPVTECLPDKLQSCNFIVHSQRDYYHGKVYGGVYTGDPEDDFSKNEFSCPGIAFEASHWMPAPDVLK
jgi:hypothetical protein